MKKTLTLLSAAVMSLAMTAQEATEAATEEKKPLEISGSVDAYFRGNINAPTERGATGAPSSNNAPSSSFGNATGFGIGMANIVLSHEGATTGFVGDVAFGPRGNDAVDGFSVNQLYGYLNVGEKTTLTLGQFNTFLGYEVISPSANFNYSTSYMFSYGPFSHTGLKADFALTDELSAMVAVMNSSSIASVTNTTGTYSLGGQLGYSVDKGAAFLNVVYGDQDGKDYEADNSVENTLQIDLTTGWNLTEKLYTGLNYTVSNTPTANDGPTANFSGIALYAQYALSDAFSLGLRGEYFETVNGGADVLYGFANSMGTQQVTDITLSANINKGNLTIIPEIRTDIASEAVFTGADFAPAYTLTSAAVAAVYSF